MIHAFVKIKSLRAMEAHSETSIQLAALLDRLGHRVEQLARGKTAFRTARSSSSVASNA